MLLDYRHYRELAARIGLATDSTLHRRLVRSACFAFAHYFIGVLDGWIGGFDPDHDPARLVAYKLKRVRAEIRRRVGPEKRLNLGSLRRVRDQLLRLGPSGMGLTIKDQIAVDHLWRDVEALLVWLKVASYWLDDGSDREAIEEESVAAAEALFLKLDAVEGGDAAAQAG